MADEALMFLSSDQTPWVVDILIFAAIKMRFWRVAHPNKLAFERLIPF